MPRKIAQWADEDQLFIASVPVLPGAVTHGAIRIEAASAILVVVADWIYGSRQLGHAVPAPHKIAGD